MQPAKPPKAKDAARTRQAILDAAKQAFTQFGYDGAGLREIAASAGASAPLVNRYFGGKEGLFSEAVTGAFTLDDALGKEREDLSAALARHVLTKKRSPSFDATLAMIRSAGNAHAASLMRESVEANVVGPLAAQLGGGRESERRAALIIAVLTGVAVMRDVIGVKPLQKQDEALQTLLTEVLDAIAKP